MRVLSLVKTGGRILMLQVSGQALMFLAHILLGRSAGVESYGVFAFSAAVVNLAIIPAKLGQDTVVLRQVPIYLAAAKYSLLRGILVFANQCVFAASAIVGLGVVLVLYTFGLIQQLLPVVIALAAMPLLALGQVRANALIGFKRAVAGQFPEYVLRPASLIAICLLFLFNHREMSANAAVGAFALVALLSFVVGVCMLQTSMASYKSTRPDFSERGLWLRSGAWMVLVSGAYQAFAQVDVVVVGATLSKEDAGVYSAASRLAVLIQFGLIALQIIAAPRIAAAYARRSMAELQNLLSGVALLSTAFAALLAIPTAVGAGALLALFGNGFEGGEAILRILLIAHLLNAMTGVTGFLLTMTGRERQAAAINVGVLVIDVIALSWLVPTYGVHGAAWVTVVATGLVHVCMAAYAWRALGVKSWISVRRLPV